MEMDKSKSTEKIFYLCNCLQLPKMITVPSTLAPVQNYANCPSFSRKSKLELINWLISSMWAWNHFNPDLVPKRCAICEGSIDDWIELKKYVFQIDFVLNWFDLSFISFYLKTNASLIHANMAVHVKMVTINTSAGVEKDFRYFSIFKFYILIDDF